MKHVILLAGIAFFVLSHSGSAHAGPMLVNGGFETGNLNGWTLVDQSKLTFVTAGLLDSFTPHSGRYFVALGAVDRLGTLSKAQIATKAGQRYTLNLFLGSDGESANEFDVKWNSTRIYHGVDIPSTDGKYELLSFTVVGTGHDKLTFSERDDYGFLALDDVSLIPATVPEPSSVVLLSTAGATLAGYLRWRRWKTAAA